MKVENMSFKVWVIMSDPMSSKKKQRYQVMAEVMIMVITHSTARPYLIEL